ncbi:DUF3866 family protein [Bacillus horti]|uniref:DUF3866 family protein n=1 Tax=Caldalkalibacillus horti TaxID=77523 RepID=A0ABT9VU54_9BACI|nr:DUF3866 family protein [Bacillus horti]MDQ0164521.1 hypothetical protein [Bacillus horti]
MQNVWGDVIKVIECREDKQILEVYVKMKYIKAIHYLYDQKKCTEGDRVLVNTSAIDLGLGTGGYGFVMAIYESHQESSSKSVPPGHIMKLRYTPVQVPVLSIESEDSHVHSLFSSSFSLEGKRVLLGELHSMLPIMASLIETYQENRKIVYIMDDQASLHIAFSEHVHFLKEKLNLTTITFGQAVGGDVETINIYTALEAAYKLLQADDIIITHGPGVIGTGSQRGFSGMQLVHWLHAIHTCGGKGIIIPRIQFRDPRLRHKGLSHHMLEPLLKHSLASAQIPYPVRTLAGVEPNSNENIGKVEDIGSQDQGILEKQFSKLANKHAVAKIPIDSFKADIEQALNWYEHPIKTMGRGYEQEPYFFYAVGAAFKLYRSNVVE